MEEIVNYAHVRGIRVLPEIDAPAHVGEGWQDTGLTVCFNVSTMIHVNWLLPVSLFVLPFRN